MLEKEEYETQSNGDQKLIKPAKLSLGRLSILRENEIPFVDDFIPISEPIMDYLTEYSGLKEGDLDPLTSTNYLTPRKFACLKIRNLSKLGAIFVGHGLESDFRRISNG